MKVHTTHIPDVLILEPKIFGDDRGIFLESWNQKTLKDQVGIDEVFVQDNHSKSSKGVLRGLHYQLPPYSQIKLVRVIEGSVLDVIVDLRKSSSTFGKHLSFILSSQNKHQLLVPHGFAHGYVVLSDSAIFSYKVDNYYSPQYERGISFDDKSLAIDWHLPFESLIISEKDKKQAILKDTSDLFD